MITLIKKRACFFRLFFIIFLSYCSVNGQGVNNLWLLGNDTSYAPYWGTYDLNFNNTSFAIDTLNHKIAQQTTNANIADTSGNLLFFTNGIVVGNALGDTMQNGSGLNPSNYTSQNPEGLYLNQAALILPLPSSNSIYYLFHSTVDYQVQSTGLYLYLSIIDMNMNGGLGSVITKNQILINDTLNVGKITACKHANGRDWWIVCHRAFSDIYYTFLLTPTGLSGPFTQHAGTYRQYDAGQVCFSPDGKKFAYFSVVTEMDILDFDRCTGMFSNLTHIAINDTAFGRGVAFSPNSQYLYAPSTRYIYQFDVTAANIAATQTTIAVWDTTMYSPPQGGPALSLQALFNIAQLAPDGKIYVSTGNSTFVLHVIDQPDSAGAACNFIPMGVQLPFYYFNSLPNHPNYFLGCDTTCGPCLTNLTPSPLTLEGGIRAAPNPSDGNFTLQFPVHSVSGELYVYDMMGNVVFRDYVAPWSQYKRVDLTKMSDGIYFCKLRWKGSNSSVKVVIKR